MKNMAWWCTPLIPEFGSKARGYEFEASLVYIASSRLARLYSEPCSQTQKQNTAKQKHVTMCNSPLQTAHVAVWSLSVSGSEQF